MLRAFKVQYTFPVAVELSDKERQEVSNRAIAAADEMDRGEDETFAFAIDHGGKTWQVYVDIGRRRVNIMTREEAARAGLPVPPA